MGAGSTASGTTRTGTIDGTTDEQGGHMAITITKASDPIRVEHVVGLIYGDPGLGKSTLGFTAEAPLCLDFDMGVHRASNRKDTVRATSWKDCENIAREDVAGYSALLVDTVGRMLDALSVQLIRDDSKNGQGGGALSLKGYGVLKIRFAAWLNLMRSFGLDVVLLAHTNEKKRGDDIIWRPDIQGGSLGEVYKCAEFVGYMHKAGRDRVIEFEPGDGWLAKNPANLGTVTVPDMHVETGFLAGLITTVKASINEQTEEARVANLELDAVRFAIETADDAALLNEAVEGASELSTAAKAIARKLVMARAKALGLVLDKETKRYMDAPAEGEAPDVES